MAVSSFPLAALGTFRSPLRLPFRHPGERSSASRLVADSLWRIVRSNRRNIQPQRSKKKCRFRITVISRTISVIYAKRRHPGVQQGSGNRAQQTVKTKNEIPNHHSQPYHHCNLAPLAPITVIDAEGSTGNRIQGPGTEETTCDQVSFITVIRCRVRPEPSEGSHHRRHFVLRRL